MKQLVTHRLQYAIKVSALFAVYYCTARIGLSFDAVSGFATLVWPPTGIALAAILILGYRYWPGIALAAFLVNVVTGAPMLVALGIATGNTLEALAGAYMLRRFVRFNTSLDRVRDVLGLVFFAAVMSTMVSATIGVSSLWLAGIVGPSAFDATWLAWWVGDMLGALVVAPLLLVWSRRPHTLTFQRVVEALLLAGLLFGVSVFAFSGVWWTGQAHFPFAYMVFPVLIWIALRFGQRGSVTAVFVVLLVAVWCTASGLGPFAGQQLSHSLLLLQSFIGVIAVTFMTMAAVVAERKKTEQKLQLSESRFRDMADTAPVAIWVTNADGLYVYLSKQWYDFTGQSAKSGLHDGWLDPIHSHDRQAVRQLLAQVHHTHAPFSIEYRLKRKLGRYHWVLHSGLPKFDAKGAFEGHIGTIIDIEDVLRRRELEEKNKQLTRQHAELMALNTAKDEFIAVASHQLRTPVTGVKQYVGMLLDGYSGKLTAQQRIFLERAYESNERQIRVLDSLLSVASVDADTIALRTEAVDLTTLVQDVLRETASTLRARNQHPVFNRGPGDFVADIDKDKVRMVVENLVDNASKYSFPGKNIEVAVGRRKNMVTIAITDYGVGIAKKDMSKLFKKFSRVDNPLSILVGGTGLGLYWSKKIIDLHGGSLTVTSKPGTQSTFTISLPAYIDPESAA